jgi:hypothetical protein
VPGSHNADTKLLGFYAHKDFLKIVEAFRKDQGRKKDGGVTPRSQLLRDAVVEYMERRRVAIPPHLRCAPDRAGKGGPKGPRKRASSETDSHSEKIFQAASHHPAKAESAEDVVKRLPKIQAEQRPPDDVQESNS